MRWLVCSSLVVALLSACQGEPGIVCDRERLFVALAELEFGTSDDIDPAREGIQIDVVVNSTLDPGSIGFLSVVDSEGVETLFDERSTADATGQFLFLGVTLPPGRIAVTIRSSSGCRAVQTSQELFVFDEMGPPACVVAFSTAPEAVELIEAPVLNASADDDPLTDDLQTSIRVDTGRDDVDITLLVRDVATGDEQVFRELSGDDAGAEFSMTLGQGTQAVRAVCIWDDFPDVPLTSPTLSVFVDTILPGCSLVTPSAAIVAGDDLDGDLGNGIQFSLVGQVSGGDTEGAPAQFNVGLEVIDASPIEADTTTATGSVKNPPPSPQDFALSGEDQAGNRCVDVVSF